MQVLSQSHKIILIKIFYFLLTICIYLFLVKHELPDLVITIIPTNNVKEEEDNSALFKSYHECSVQEYLLRNPKNFENLTFFIIENKTKELVYIVSQMEKSHDVASLSHHLPKEHPHASRTSH